MKKQEMILFLKDLQKVRDLLTPAQAAQVPNIFPKVKETKEVKKGQRVNIDGQVFEAREDIKKIEHEDLKNNKKWQKSPPDPAGRFLRRCAGGIGGI